MNENMIENTIIDTSGNANENNSANRREKDRIFAGLPYLYRSKGLPSEVYEVRFREQIDPELLNRSIADTLERYPYFAVRLLEEKGDFYAVPNDLPLEAFHTQELIPLGGAANHYHMMGVSFWKNVLKISFHHGLTDGRGAKSFLETLVNDYADYAIQKKRLENGSKDAPGSAVKDSAGEKECFENAYKEVQEKHHEKASELSDAEYIDPCENKHELTGKSGKVEGLASKGFKLPKAANKSGHRRYELRFSQKEFMGVCKKYGASPIILLSFMENLALDTYLISYVGQFDVPEDYVDEVHLYSNCSDGLVLNMTCQSGNFIIDLTQDFESAAYVEALQKEFAAEGISVKGSDEILFETPYDELSEIITPAPDTAEQLKGIWESFAAAAKASVQAAKEREAASLALSASIQERAMRKPDGSANALTGVSDGRTEVRPASAKGHSAPAVTAMYYDLATGTMKTFDPTKNTKEQLENLVRSTPAIFAS